MQVVDDLLDFSRLEVGKLQLEPRSFELRRVVELTLQPLRVQAQDKGIELSCEIAPDAPVHLRADPVRLAQVLSNVVSNAVKFTEQGYIDVRVCVVEQSAQAATLWFSVADTGIGIAPDAQSTIFNAFTQINGEAASKHGGSGLGLALCKALVQLMQGGIEVASQPGVGSTFQFKVKVALTVALSGVAAHELSNA
jgi:signal transduction histidine kinase